jgi:hypothetical protein
MRGDPGSFDIDKRLGEHSAKGDDLERLKAIVDFEIFRPISSAPCLGAIEPRAVDQPTITC